LEVQTRNRERLQRVTATILDQLGTALDAEERAADQSQAPRGTGPDAATADADVPDPASLQAERQRLEQADSVRVETEKAMQQALEDLEAASDLPAHDPELSTALDRARQSVDLTLAQTEALRRLFFSVIDHLRETLRRQVDLGDRTEEAAVLAATEPAEEIARRLGILAPEQESLAETAGNIADALDKQAQQPPPAPPETQDPDGQQAALAKDERARLGQAAELVASAHDLMDQAADAIAEESAPFQAIRGHQQQAAEALANALAALQPPRQKQQDQQQEEQQGEKGQEEPQQADQGKEDKQQQTAPSDPGQLLQGVRDREAQRREQRAEQQHHGYEPVEKDW
jgi:hypothetical protein